MKTIKLLVGICALAAMSACGNTKSDSQNPTQAAETTVEATKEQGTVFYDITLEEALKKAKAEGKYVLIDFHATTCVPCKKMEKEVFPTPECGEYINTHFVPIMIDGEDDGVGTEMAKEYQVFIFPTYLILSPDGFKEGEILGAECDVEKFLGMLKEIIHDKL
jgi:thiol:disulfide interchange protein